MNDYVGERIKKLRVKNGLTQLQLAEKLGKVESSVRMWELGKSIPDIKTLKSLSEIFSVSTDSLLCERDIQDIADETIDPEIRIIQRAAQKMDKTQKKKMLNILKASFDELFDED